MQNRNPEITATRLGIYYTHSVLIDSAEESVAISQSRLLLLLQIFSVMQKRNSNYCGGLSWRRRRSWRMRTRCSPRNSPVVARSDNILLWLLCLLPDDVRHRTLVAGFVIVLLRPATIPLRCLWPGWMAVCETK